MPSGIEPNSSNWESGSPVLGWWSWGCPTLDNGRTREREQVPRVCLRRCGLRAGGGCMHRVDHRPHLRRALHPPAWAADRGARRRSPRVRHRDLPTCLAPQARTSPLGTPRRGLRATPHIHCGPRMVGDRARRLRSSDLSRLVNAKSYETSPPRCPVSPGPDTITSRGTLATVLVTVQVTVRMNSWVPRW